LARVVDDRPVDLFHAHGTGTVQNDAVELAAIESVVARGKDSDRPIVYSHKAAIGHSLGASGLLSVVLNCQAHVTGSIPPNVNTTEPMPTRRVTIRTAATQECEIRRSVAIAAGFGGALGVVSLVSS
jgi:3-oxoacyl-(acyl-carrier-protein) synthase